jgi:hypothetical protein
LLQKSGNKQRLIRRIVKKTLALKNDELGWTTTLLEAAIGPPVVGDTSTSGLIRRFYTENYKALDQFDQLWYACRYDYREASWQTSYLWAVILDCVVNARSAWCEAHGERQPIKEFVQALVDEFGTNVARS